MADLLAAVFPEQVAVRSREGVGFYAGGFRVRGKGVINVSGNIPRVFLLGPVVDKFKYKADAGNATLQGKLSALPLPRSVTDHDAPELEVVFVRQAGHRLLWMCVSGGATEADLVSCWKGGSNKMGMTSRSSKSRLQGGRK